jgi:hypothetical protein
MAKKSYKSSKSSSDSAVSAKKIVLGILTTVILIAMAVGGYMLYQAYLGQKERADRLSNPAEAAKEETKQLIEAVSKLTDLPDEEPTIATVRDVNELEGQSFFQNAQNGDKVLIFTKAKKAILYRPSTNKVIEIAPVTLGNNQGTEVNSEPSASQPQTQTKDTDSEDATQQDQAQ